MERIMENKIRGDVSMGFIQNVDLIQAKTKESIAPPPNTFGDPFTVVTGRTLRFEPWEIGEKNPFSKTPPKSDKNVREKTQHLGNRFLVKPQGPQAPNLGHHR
jgi:hypothetical protein